MKPAVFFTLLAVAITATHAQRPQVIRNPQLIRDEADCPKYCLDIYDPVGDEEGYSYPNECYMKRAKCQSKEETIAPFWKKMMVINEDPTSQQTPSPSPKKNCPGGCPDVENPVCGSDGVKYGNPCELKIAACKHPELNIVEDDSGKAGVGSKKKPLEE